MRFSAGKRGSKKIAFPPFRDVTGAWDNLSEGGSDAECNGIIPRPNERENRV